MSTLAATRRVGRRTWPALRKEYFEAGRLRNRRAWVVVDGQAQDSDGKTDASGRIISLDPFTIAALRKYIGRLDDERAEFGSSYPNHGKLIVSEDGRRLHPDTITSRFNRLVDRAGSRRIRLHDIRHTYATLARDLGVNGKIVTGRLGHANETVTQQIYTHASTGQDRAAAEMIAQLIAEALIGPR